MKELFVIIDGEYSDWDIIGYTDSEESAMQICAQHNENIDNHYRYDWYYEKVSRIDSHEKNVPLQHIHIIRFYREKKGVSMADVFDSDYCLESSNKALEKTEILEAPAWIIVKVPLKEINWERAKKIAQDTVYKYLYEKNMN